jgi:glyoxylase-like metal-dependent hydrolase (beta-lactamase superfamily II)/rhodanese-related sulfurtransferase
VTEDIVTPVPDRGLGNHAYLVDLGDGRALAVDACLDLRHLRQQSEARGLRIAFAADTHLHADFLSGARQLAAEDGAHVLASTAGRREFGHQGLADLDEVDLGGLTLRALATPGHTDEHLSYVLLDGSHELGVFTGGSLITGSAARVDLVAPERTEELARAQFRSLHRLAELPDHTRVWPTHGGGSFCSSAATGNGTVSSIGAERTANPLLAAPDEDTFVRMLRATMGSFPPYFLRLGEQNRQGPPVVTGGDPALPSLPPVAVAAAVADGAQLIDVRPIAAFAAAHPTGAVSIALRDAFASWLGWLCTPDSPILLVRDADQDVDELLWQATKIGYHNIVGEVAGGIDSWTAAGLPTASVSLVGPDDSHGLQLLDVRQAAEFESGHVPTARHLELGALAAGTSEPRTEPTVLMCGHGERAMSAASLLTRSGVRDVRVLEGGPQEVADATGAPLVTGG